MPNQLPVKSLVKLNWAVSLMCSILIFIFLFSITKKINDAVNGFFQAFLFLLLIGFFNLLFLKIFPDSFDTAAKTKPWLFYIFSYSWAGVSGFFTQKIYSVINGTSLGESIEGNIFWDYMPSVVSVLALNTLILILQNHVILLHKKAKGEMENLELKAVASETTNLLLRQQIHPHFLFNALNTINLLYQVDLKQGEEYLIHLANFLRTSISNHSSAKVKVKNELEFCMDYLKMQKVRFGTALEYTISISEEIVQTKYLPYFSLQPLVENVLKHNDLTEESPIRIMIKEVEGFLCVSNNLQPRKYKGASSGHGLFNLSERYRLLGSEDIRIESSGLEFCVKLKILDT